MSFSGLEDDEGYEETKTGLKKGTKGSQNGLQKGTNGTYGLNNFNSATSHEDSLLNEIQSADEFIEKITKLNEMLLSSRKEAGEMKLKNDKMQGQLGEDS